jgi:maleamate amidohydrolase
MTEATRQAGFGGRGGAGRHPCLLVVDATCAFTESDSPLVCDAEEAVTAIAKLLAAARKAGVMVVFSTVVVGEPQRRAAAHFLRKMPGLLSIGDDPRRSQVDPRLTPRTDEVVIEKIFPSVFFGSALPSMLAAEGIDTVMVTGMSTSGCVRATAVDALQYGFRPIVVQDAVADRDPGAHAAALHDLELKYADVVSLDAGLKVLRAAAPTRRSEHKHDDSDR